MKRGWIHWDRSELPAAVFEERLARVRKLLAERELPALVVYTDVWRSNQARYFVNFMPYWNRALLILSREDPPVLLCGLSPRVYPWIRSVTVLEEIRFSSNLARQLLELASEKQWKQIGILDGPQLPHDLRAPLGAGTVEAVDLPSREIGEPAMDEWELAMRRRAATMAREVLAEEIAGGTGMTDHQFVGQLERRFRRAGAEDLVILLSNGATAPVPASGTVLGEEFSVSVALEYRGHWVKLSRPRTSAQVAESLRNRFRGWLENRKAPADTPVYLENLAGSYPYEFGGRFQVGRGAIVALHVESRASGRRLFYGDTCRYGETGAELL